MSALQRTSTRQRTSPRGRLGAAPLIAGLALVSSCSGPLGPGAVGDGREVPPIRSDARNVRLSGDRLMFSVEDNSIEDAPLFWIFELDLATGIRTTILNDTLSTWGQDVSGDRVAWFDQDGLVTEDRRDGLRVRHPGWSGSQISLDGDLAVFEGSDGTRSGIMLADLSTGSIDQLWRFGGAPVIQGDRVAWIEVFRGVTQGTRSVIKLYDAVTGDTIAIANERTGMGEPYVGESAVAWTVNHGSRDVYAYDFETEPFAVATGPADQFAVAVLSGFIVWLEDRSPGDDRLAVHLLDLSTGEVRRVSDWGVGLLAADDESLLLRDGDELIHFTPR